MDQAVQLPHRPGAVLVGRVWVAGPVGERMMPPVGRDPVDDRTLEAHRSGEREPGTQRRCGGEAAVGQQPVEADSHAEPGQEGIAILVAD
jgi:hypothetical protein